ncbi:MAG: gamma-glutamyltransferase [Calditrichaeota bacterium]|nr:MAG: gamma-glutamyltransferase [Calditrichota bacterium]
MQAVVASGHIRVSEAACHILQNDGNAFDAVVAAGFASVVAEPLLTSLGGGGFLLARPDDAQPVLFDFFVDTPGLGQKNPDREAHFLPITVEFPGSEQIFNVGYGSVAVPGVLRGLLHVHKKLGRLPLREILAPAVQLARFGTALNATQAYILELLEPIMQMTDASRKMYAPAGKILQKGSHFQNAELAAFLETLPKNGDKEFYEGKIARSIFNDMYEHDGLLTRDDLASYHVIERTPLAVNYRDQLVLTNPLPSFGGSMLSYALNWLEKGMPGVVQFGSSDHLFGLVTLMKELYDCREKENIFTQLNPQAKFAENIKKIRKAFGGTTHISVLDAAGNAASLTCSNGEGSGYVVPGTGIMLNNMMGEDDLHPDGFHNDPPGKRVASMMSPSILLKENQVQLVAGSGGSKRIWTALLQVISNVIDFKMNIHEAVHAPRLHWDGTTAQIEPGFKPESMQKLRDHFPVNEWQVRDVYFGGVHAVDCAGQGGGDSRRDGAVAVI